jgi:hypothetical protein
MAIRATLLALLVACKPAATEPPKAAPDCLDQQLAKLNLDQYGGDQGTMYPGGTPLFQESTGKRLDRTQYVYAHHPEIAALCAGADAGP